MPDGAGPDGGLTVRLVQAGPIPLDVEASCGPGEVLALIGPSGSGKSTILRAIAGLYRPARGRIACAGQVWFDAGAGAFTPPHARAVGFVFQSYALFPHMTALGNVMAALGHRPRSEREGRARDLLGLVNLAGLEQRRPAHLSGGQQQRVAVARALARDPKALLLDEPFSAVDKVTRGKLYHELAALRRMLSIPVVLVTHDLDEATLLADRISVLHRGRTLQAGPPHDVLAKPASVEVARVVGVRNVFADGTTVAEHRPDAALTLLDWAGRRIEARHQPCFRVGERVAWMIPSGRVILHRRDRPSRGEHENPISGVVGAFVVLGDNASITIHVGGRRDLPLSMTVPAHVAARNGIAAGETVTVSLLAEGIHLMPLPRDER